MSARSGRQLLEQASGDHRERGYVVADVGEGDCRRGDAADHGQGLRRRGGQGLPVARAERLAGTGTPAATQPNTALGGLGQRRDDPDHPLRLPPRHLARLAGLRQRACDATAQLAQLIDWPPGNRGPISNPSATGPRGPTRCVHQPPWQGRGYGFPSVPLFLVQGIDSRPAPRLASPPQVNTATIGTSTWSGEPTGSREQWNPGGGAIGEWTRELWTRTRRTSVWRK